MSDGKVLTGPELETMQVLIYLYIKLGSSEAAERGLNAILAIDPANLWALGMRAIVSDSKGEYEDVIRFTDDLKMYDDEKKKSLSFLRARALMKLGKEQEAKEYLQRNLVQE